MQLTSFSDPFTTNMYQVVQNLQKSVKTFHFVLEEYREHEAREMLCQELREQLSSVYQLQATLQKCLQENEQLLLQQK